jgi:hypothetical protein
MPSITRLALLAAAAALVTACSEQEEQTTQTEPPAAVEPAPETAGDETANDETDDAIAQLRDGANSLMEGGRKLSEEAAVRANRALDDAGPALEKAGEVARDVGEAVDQLVDRAISDFETAITLLEQRIDEAETADEPVASDADAVLAPAEQLNADTSAAARAVPAGIGPDYVGVWAAEASACRRIDQESVKMFAVITPTTIRRYENVCNFDTVPLDGESATVAASCIAEGDTEERDISFTMPSPGILQIGRPDQSILAELVRCHLPEQQ